MKHPQQPLVVDPQGVIRFKANAIIQWLQLEGKIDLNEIAVMDFSDEDRAQLAQLIGYSVSGFGDLQYVDEAELAVIDAQADKLIEEGP